MQGSRLSANSLGFLLGLILYTIGQFLIFVVIDDLEALHAQEPIDFAHSLMLLGLLLLIPKVGDFSKSVLGIIGKAFLVLGIGLLIGMCVLDMVFWALDDGDLKRQVATELINNSAIWTPFMRASGPIFNVGLLICGIHYFTSSKPGVALIAIGTLVIYLGGGWLNVVGYSTLTFGFYLSFLKAEHHL